MGLDRLFGRNKNETKAEDDIAADEVDEGRRNFIIGSAAAAGVATAGIGGSAEAGGLSDLRDEIEAKKSKDKGSLEEMFDNLETTPLERDFAIAIESLRSEFELMPDVTYTFTVSFFQTDEGLWLVASEEPTPTFGPDTEDALVIRSQHGDSPVLNEDDFEAYILNLKEHEMVHELVSKSSAMTAFEKQHTILKHE